MSGRSWPSAATLLAIQVRSQIVQFVRIPVAVFFTILLPLVMLVVFNAVFAGGDEIVESASGPWPMRQFYVAALAGFTAVSATFTRLAESVPQRRQDGVIKRWRGTPLPPWIYLGGFIGSGVVIAIGGVLVMVAVGVAFYGTEVDAGKLPAAAVTFLLGVSTFSALGTAVAGVVRRPEATAAVANAIVLPLAFISNTFIAVDHGEMPRWLDVAGDVLPLKPFVASMQEAFNPTVAAPGLAPAKLAVVAAWGVAGLAVAVAFFKWAPVADRREGRQRGAVGARGSEDVLGDSS